MELYVNKSECYGCGACENACALGAITMQADEEGFLYPVIDAHICIDCGKCKQACQIHSLTQREGIQPLVFAGKNKDEEVRARSTSGGMFSVFAQEIIENEGAVYGVAFDERFHILHERAETTQGYEKFLGSKYAQSKIGDVYKRLKKDLLEDKQVLFSGTPCQIAGLTAYLGKLAESENLILCEIICHGAPSPLMWQEHIAFIEKERKSKVIGYKNRSKVAGWHAHNEHFFLENGKNEYKSKLSQNHKDLFYAHLTIRPSCYQCAYTSFPRIADITIADYWGIELCMKDFDDNKGTSLLIINTAKAERFFERVKDKIELRESNLEDAFRDNHKRPAKRNVNRDAFWRDYHAKGYAYVLRKYSSYTKTGRIKRWAKFTLKAIIKKIGLYNFVHKFTQKKYQKDTYK